MVSNITGSNTCLIERQYAQHHFNGHFPGKPGSAILSFDFQQGVMKWKVLQTVCPSCYPTNSVKALIKAD